MATIDDQTLESFRWNNHSNLSAVISPFLASYLRRRNIYSISDFKLNPHLDFSYYKADLTSSLQLAGVEIFAPFAETFIIPALNTGVLTGQINVTDFTNNLKILNQQFGNTGPTDGLNYQLWYGNISKLTNLEHIAIVSAITGSSGSWVLPKLSDNQSLERVIYLGPGFTSSVTVLNTGNLQGNLLLKEFRMTYNNNNSRKDVVDNVLSSLRAQKIAGGAISIIDFTASAAPTGGSSNADYVWLTSNGVSVTLGTF